MRKHIIDGKPVIVKANSKNIPPLTEIRKVYAKIPDNKKIPVVFQTKEQYLDEYIQNQEKAHKVEFTAKEKNKYKKQELASMKNIVSRYTTNHNPYIDRRVVFFNDKKIPVKQFHDSALHEYGHELWEKNPKLRRDWKSVSRTTSPTPYGKTCTQEDFAESFMLAKTGRLEDPKREQILSDAVAKNRMKVWHGNIEQQTIQNPNFRDIAFTGKHTQLSLMSLKPGQDIGLEKHDKVDQFFRIEQGKAQFNIDKGKEKFIIGPSSAAIIPAGTWHNIKSIGKQPLKLYSIYSPPTHPSGTILRDKPSKNNEDIDILELRETLADQDTDIDSIDFNTDYARAALGGGFQQKLQEIIPYSSTPQFQYLVSGVPKTYDPGYEVSDLGTKVNIIAGRKFGDIAGADKIATSEVALPKFMGIIKETPTKDMQSWNSQIYLLPKKLTPKSYRGSDTKMVAPGRDTILITQGLKKVDTSNPENVDAIARIIGHEELHNILEKSQDKDTSLKLDNISVGPITEALPKGRENIYYSKGANIYPPMETRNRKAIIRDLPEETLRKDLHEDQHSLNLTANKRKEIVDAMIYGEDLKRADERMLHDNSDMEDFHRSAEYWEAKNVDGKTNTEDIFDAWKKMQPKKDEDSKDMAIEWKKQKGQYYKEMSPTEYLEKTGRTIGINEDTGERVYINKDSRMHKQDDEGQTVQEFAKDILDPNKTIKVEAPYLYTEGEYAQEGRHRALGAEIAGLKTIPVATNMPEEYRSPEVFEKFKEKLVPKGHKLQGFYGEEWKERFKKRPDTYMGETFREAYKEALAEQGLNPNILYEPKTDETSEDMAYKGFKTGKQQKLVQEMENIFEANPRLKMKRDKGVTDIVYEPTPKYGTEAHDYAPAWYSSDKKIHIRGAMYNPENPKVLKTALTHELTHAIDVEKMGKEKFFNIANKSQEKFEQMPKKTLIYPGTEEGRHIEFVTPIFQQHIDPIETKAIKASRDIEMYRPSRIVQRRNPELMTEVKTELEEGLKDSPKMRDLPTIWEEDKKEDKDD